MLLERQCQMHLDLHRGAQPLGKQIYRLRNHQVARFDAVLRTAFQGPAEPLRPGR